MPHYRSFGEVKSSPGKIEKRSRFNDIYLSAYLLCKGVELIEVDYSNSNTIFFVFEENKDLVMKWVSGEAEVNVQQYVSSLKTIRRLLYSGTKRND